MTGIEWTDVVWNPTTGCDRVSPGCDNCYAMTMAKRLKGMGSGKYQTDGDPRTSGPGFGLAMHANVLALPLSWRKPRRVFVNSMSDLFHPKVTDEFIARVFAVMALTPQHTYQVLTKRAPRMASLIGRGSWGTDGFADMVEEAILDISHGGFDQWPLPNVWLGVSVENQEQANARIPRLLETPAAVRWLSCEPLLGPVTLPLLTEVNGCTCYGGKTVYGHEPGCGTEPGPAWGNLGWVVVGGESGPGARPMLPAWALSLRDQCTSAGVPFFFKQWGEWCHQDHLDPDVWRDIDAAINLGQSHHPQPLRVGKNRAGRLLDGRTWDEYPS